MHSLRTIQRISYISISQVGVPLTKSYLLSTSPTPSTRQLNYYSPPSSTSRNLSHMMISEDNDVSGPLDVCLGWRNDYHRTQPVEDKKILLLMLRLLLRIVVQAHLSMV